jgi:hypothetical protein
MRVPKEILAVVRAAPYLLIASLFGCAAAPIGTRVDANRRGETVHTVFRRQPTDSVAPGCIPLPAYTQSIAVGVVEFNDRGTYVDRAQVSAVADCISESRRLNSNGVVVLVFAHGWHHNATWDVENDGGDLHFKAFRRVMMSLVLREAERARVRSVVGVYVGWRGKTSEGLLSSITEHFTFWSRLRVAERIGNSADAQDVIVRIVDATKRDLPGSADSPLIFAGHSMGALILETAFLSTLRTEPNGLLRDRSPASGSCAGVVKGTQPVLFPDLVLLLNAATDARIGRSMSELLQRQGVVRQIDCGSMKYAAPVVVSVTSEADVATGTWFPLGSGGRKTEGHDQSLITHSFRQAGGALCPPRRDDFIVNDFNQDWHCLREPVVINAYLRSLAIDLPGPAPRDTCKVRYRLAPVNPGTSASFWNFQVPREVMGGHSDVFNTRSNLLVMALAQMSGGVLSVARDWLDVFEPEAGLCTLPSS